MVEFRPHTLYNTHLIKPSFAGYYSSRLLIFVVNGGELLFLVFVVDGGVMLRAARVRIYIYTPGMVYIKGISGLPPLFLCWFVLLPLYWLVPASTRLGTGDLFIFICVT